MDSERGLVITPGFRSSCRGYSIGYDEEEDQILRSQLLLWDRLEFPVDHSITLGSSPDVDFLAALGILHRTETSGYSGDVGDILTRSARDVYFDLDRLEPGKWSFAAGSYGVSFGSQHLATGRGVLVQLTAAIPVPNSDVPLEDILLFKERRKSELLALRFHLETVYQRVVSAGDSALATKTEVEKLDLAIAENFRASKEAPFKFRLSELQAQLNLVPTAIGGLAAASMGLPISSGLITGAVAGLSVSPGAALVGKPVNSTPFEYVSSIHSEFLR